MIFAQALTESPLPPSSLSPGDYGAAFMQMFLTLMAVVLLLWVTVWFLRNMIQKRLQKGSGAQSIQVLERRVLSPKSMLYLVEVEGKRILVAESQVEVRRLTEIQEESDSAKEST